MKHSAPKPVPPAESHETAGALSRRGFLAAGLGAPLVAARAAGARSPAPGDKLRIAAVGIGGMGKSYLEGCKDEHIVALCDLDHARPSTQEVFAKFPGAARYRDFREMFEREAKNFDALIVATPDHTHAVIALAGLKLGKHLYCAKPIAHSVAEVRKIKAAVLAAPHLVTKASVQSSASDAACRTAELLEAQVIGAVREVHIWCDHPTYPCSLVRPKDTPTPPDGLDWDLWIGPAPFRPYHPAYHPSNWRSWWDFGSGAVGDMACHTLHAYFRELRLGAPATIYGSSSTRHDGFFEYVATPESQGYANLVTWEYPARGRLPPLKLHWYDGGMRPHRPDELDTSMELPRSGVLFVGEGGKLVAGFAGGNPYGKQGRGVPGGLLLPEEKFRGINSPPKVLARCDPADHYREWVRACKEGRPTVCPVEFGCEMTEVALLGALALRTKRLLTWDSAAARVTNHEQANAIVNPTYRDGWTL
jgi:predicted dehydrogenase